ncbi:MAG TPA: AAA family ATPase [Leptospiraceae bacterium]|nr:AAA family ATPase [Leptospiraceae bacterium]HMW08247.1 AAA family ATPase [Leptospiraceae bacterium]HMX33985.1 AAA family ATPase [Leptospiraceae bacterium]HMY29652.1 AAA family ATPase [Leptospiraceae bacterium]HMZ66573.1 AAA family ATPase [Leptospiraceae bacterium]
MKIESVRIENFRSFKDQTIHFDDYTCFVGPNGAGKSTVFNALNVFFRQFKDSKTDLSKLTESDFHHKNISEDIRITVTFKELSKQAKEDLSDYVRQDKLVVTAAAKYDKDSGRAEVKQYGNRLGFIDFKVFFEAEKEGKKASELKAIFANLKEKYKDLRPATTREDMANSLQEYEAAHSKQCDLIPSEDQFYGATKGANKLSPHIQWVFVSASKDATEESEESKTSALGQLLARTVRSKVNFSEKIIELREQVQEQYKALLKAEQSALDDISKSLQSRLTSWAHPNLTANVLWKEDSEKSIKIEDPFAFIQIGERGFEGDLSRFGHGLQRSYMLALLQELAHYDDKNSSTLIMGIEEPELYQHPPQARYLAETLIDLSEKGTQVFLCTHSPLFIPGDNFDKIRIVRDSGKPSFTAITSLSYKSLSDELKKVGEKHLKESGMVAKLYPSLNPVVNEMFFCKALVLVEGQEDLAYLTSYLFLTDKIYDFRKYGCHIVPVDSKSNLIKPLAMAKLLNIPSYVIFDADTNKDSIPDENKRKSEVGKHKKDNKSILSLQGHDTENEWPSNHIIKENLTCWKTNLTDCIKSEIGEKWESYRNQCSTFYNHASDLEKNPLAIAKTSDLAWADGQKSKILSDLVDRIIEFGKKSLNV